MHHLKDPKYFANELALRHLVKSGRASIIYIHGTARSGSTIAEIVVSQLANFAIHQPFRGTLQKCGGRFRSEKLDFDADIYDLACGLIVEQINNHLQVHSKVTVVIKELAGFFKPYIWQRWLEIPQQFLFTIREPHLQYISWLSAITDKVFAGAGKLQSKRNFVIEKAAITETSILPAEWEGTTISCNLAAWNALIADFKQVKEAMIGTSKKLVILDSVLLRYDPQSAVQQIFDKLGFSPEKLSQLELNSLAKFRHKIQDIRDKSRPMVQKANNSQTINPLTLDEAVNLDILPKRSQNHIRKIIPLYLDLLYAPEQICLPTLAELATNQGLQLIKTHPFMAYAIAMNSFKDRHKSEDFDQVSSWLKCVTKDDASQTRLNLDDFNSSLAVVNSYWRNK